MMADLCAIRIFVPDGDPCNGSTGEVDSRNERRRSPLSPPPEPDVWPCLQAIENFIE